MSFRDKFLKHQLTLLHLVALVPFMIDKFVWCYSIDSSELDSGEVKKEFAQWQQLCLKLPTDNRPATPLETLDIVQTDYATSRSFRGFLPLCMFQHAPQRDHSEP